MLEHCKSRAVKESKVSYDCTMKQDALALCDVQWIDSIDLSDNEIYQDSSSLTMTTEVLSDEGQTKTQLELGKHYRMRKALST